MMRNLVSLLFTFVFILPSVTAQIFIDDFGTAGGGLSSTSVILTNQCYSASANSDYFGVVLESQINQSFVGASGAFLAGQDMNGGPCSTGSGTATWSAISIAGNTNLVLCLDIAEGSSSDGNEDWDASSNVSISVSVDGVTENLTEISAQNATNTFPAFNCDGDNIGESTIVTDAFTTYCFPISQTGNTLDILININGLDAGDEDIAIDNVAVYDATNAVVVSADFPCGGLVLTPGCTDANACNFNATANVDDGSCFNIGDTCNDGDSTTQNDIYTDCATCAGTVVQNCNPNVGTFPWNAQ